MKKEHVKISLDRYNEYRSKEKEVFELEDELIKCRDSKAIRISETVKVSQWDFEYKDTDYSIEYNYLELPKATKEAISIEHSLRTKECNELRSQINDYKSEIDAYNNPFTVKNIIKATVRFVLSVGIWELYHYLL